MNQKFPFKKRVFSQLAGRCLLISTVLLAVKSPAKAAVEAVFNTPGFKGAATTTVEDKIISLIRGAPAGSLIRASQYRFGRENVANEFIQASQRGVDVRFIFDGNLKDHLLNSDHPLSKLVTQLKCEDHSCITFCSHGSCQGIHINHNKFILFSELDNGQKNIVAQTSSNLEEAQLHNYNDLVVVSENNSLYENFLKYWSKLQDDRFRINIKNSAPGDEMVSAYFFPVLIGRDPVLKVLKKTECHLPGSKIRVMQSRFDNSRVKIAKRLRKLADEGCDVQVMVREEPEHKSPGTKIRETLGSNLKVLPFKTAGMEEPGPNSIHSKIVLIEASIDGSKDKKTLVMTGSHNLNLTSLRLNDEVLLKIWDPVVFADYLKYWNRMTVDAASILQ